jgi:hypothetical protein
MEFTSDVEHRLTTAALALTEDARVHQLSAAQEILRGFRQLTLPAAHAVCVGGGPFVALGDGKHRQGAPRRIDKNVNPVRPASTDQSDDTNDRPR